jgi:hypothetical protein
VSGLYPTNRRAASLANPIGAACLNMRVVAQTPSSNRYSISVIGAVVALHAKNSIANLGVRRTGCIQIKTRGWASVVGIHRENRFEEFRGHFL